MCAALNKSEIRIQIRGILMLIFDLNGNVLVNFVLLVSVLLLHLWRINLAYSTGYVCQEFGHTLCHVFRAPSSNLAF